MLLTSRLWIAALFVASPPAFAGAQSATEAPTAAVAAARALRPGDGFRVRIFREPDLSGEFVVDDRGIVVLPKIGEWPVAGVPADSVRPRLLAAYKRYLTTDAIEITPFRRVAVTGAVLKPGLYPIDPSMSVADAIILAGGVAPNGKRDAAELRLAGGGAGTPVSGERRLWESGAGGTVQLHVPQRSWMSRNIVQTISLTLSVVTAATFLINVTRR
jgi:polysaccharide export outer membrane protein